MFKVEEKFRLNVPNTHPFYSEKGANHGAFIIHIQKGICLFCIASEKSEESEGWNHVSVTVKKFAKTKGKLHDLHRCPTWEEMCFVKKTFWEESDVVLQFHPDKGAYINNHPYCLHLWSKDDLGIQTPPGYLIGIPELNPSENES